MSDQEFFHWMQPMAGNPAHMANEPIVNGMWNAILNRFYPGSVAQWFILPEARPAAGTLLRADLCVYLADANLNLTPHLLFEGKAQAGDSFALIQTQLRAWADGLALLNNQCCYLVGARGNTVMFFTYQRQAGVIANIRSIVWNGVGHQPTMGAPNNAAVGTTFNLNNVDHHAVIAQVVRRMSDGAPQAVIF